ncbi:MAG TPA: galactokinase family protein [Verrucomicrobiae bacterium]|jgi:galactokinase|nr:galactokinase family protein [Verrucomicrobiae bacterium]
MSDAQSLYRKHFNTPAVHLIRAPGRLELLGNHTDYNEGLVLALAVDKEIQMAVSPRNDGKIELISTAFPQPEIFWADQAKKNPAAPWTDYIKGVLEQLRHRGVHFKGFNAAIHGTIPMGAGMSSSAALEVATTLAVRQLYPFRLTETGLGKPPERDTNGKLSPLTPAEKLEYAKVCRAAEADFVGVKVGLLDQISSLFGKAAHVMEIDFRSLTVEWAPMAGEAIIVCNSGVKHSLVEGAYNELRRNCEEAAAALGRKFLREVDMKFLTTNKSRLTERQYQCAYHIVGENQRVVAGARALQDGDRQQFGQYMFQSHESSRDYFKNSTKELDLLVELARTHAGCLGARLTGGGFGGATINLVDQDAAKDFMASMSRQYEQKSGHKLEPILCQIVNGAE